MSETQQETQTREAASAAAAKGQGPPPEEIAKAVNAAKAAARFQDAADALKREAALVRDPEQRERLWQAAYAKEKEAHGESKKARIMASGWGQGAGLAIGISSAVGMGLGNVVGALLSGVVAIPGVLVGTGVGAIHGPWYKLKDAMSGGGGEKEKAGVREGAGAEQANAQAKAMDGDEETDEEDDEKAHQAIVDAARKLEADEGSKEGGGKDGDEFAGGDKPASQEKVEEKPEKVAEDKPEKVLEDKPERVEDKPEKIGDKQEKVEHKPEEFEDKPEKPSQPVAEDDGKGEAKKQTAGD